MFGMQSFPVTLITSRLYQCLRHTFSPNSPCNYFRWITKRGQFEDLDIDNRIDPLQDIRDTFPLAEYYDLLARLPPPDLHPTLPTLHDLLQSHPPPSSSQPSSSQTKDSWVYCTKPTCNTRAARDCQNGPLCAKCCSQHRRNTGDSCRSKRHQENNNSTTTPLATVSQQVLTTLDGQPQHTTFKRNLSDTLANINVQRREIARNATESDRAVVQALREVDKSVCIEYWTSVRHFTSFHKTQL